MHTRIALRLSGIDLRDTDAWQYMNADLDDLFFEGNGAISCAVLLTQDADPHWAVTDAARRLTKHLPGVVVTEVYDEFVSVADIAARCSVAAEAVRLWAAGKRRASLRPFPQPRQVVGSGSGGKTMNLYAWREVLIWAREIIGIDPDEGITYLDDAALAHLNADLAGQREWTSVDAMTRRFSSSNVATFLSHAITDVDMAIEIDVLGVSKPHAEQVVTELVKHMGKPLAIGTHPRARR